jgi:Tfp pilus assembly protein PilV
MSLLEVLLATVIFMMAMSGITALISSAVDNALDASRTNTASSIARSMMADLEAGAGEVSLTAGGSGTVPDNTQFEYTVTTQQVNLNTYLVDITVTSAAGVGRRSSVQLRQYVFDPYLLNNGAKLESPTASTETTTGTTTGGTP